MEASLYQVAKQLGLKCNTLRYWVNKNKKDHKESNIFPDLCQFVQKRNFLKMTANGLERDYLSIVVIDVDKFVEQFKNYKKLVAENKQTTKTNSRTNWTDSAIDCYLAGLTCSKCVNNHICRRYTDKGEIPPMKKTVLLLVTRRGVPVCLKECERFMVLES